MLKGKTAMVWTLRNWQGGDPAAQLAQAQELGLTSVGIKCANGTARRWEQPGTPKQNADLLPATLATLVPAGVDVWGWGYHYGRGTYPPFASIAASEGANVVAIMAELVAQGMLATYAIDAEVQFREGYRRAGQVVGLNMAAEADKLLTALHAGAPTLELGLCSYRFPTVQTDFAWNFARGVAFHMPQVYWWGDDRPDAGSLQLARSVRELQAIRNLPVIPIGSFRWDSHPWWATPTQIAGFLAGAKAGGSPAAGMYTLDIGGDGPLSSQLPPVRDFQWITAPPRPWATATPAEKDAILLELARRGALVDAQGNLSG